MKIVYFNYMNDLYGSSIGSTIKAIKLLGGLSSQGWNVSFFWRRQGVKEPADMPSKPSTWKRVLRPLLFTPKELLKNVIDFWWETKIVNREKPNIIIVRLDAFRISGYFVSLWRRIPMVIEADGANGYEWIHYHGGVHIWNSVLLLCEGFMLKRAAGIFAQSNETKRYLLHQHKLSEDRVVVITNGAVSHNPMDEKQKISLKEKLGLPPECVIIGFLGSMHHWHGVTSMETVLQEILSDHPRVWLLFVGGGGAFADRLQKLLGRVYSRRILFLGTIPYEKVQQYIELFDIAIAPYPRMKLFYFSPVKIFDYMATGRAIVAPRIGQIGELLKDHQTALLYPPGDLDRLRANIEELIHDSALRKNLGDNARKEFLARHTWTHKSKELYNYLLRVCEQW